MCVCVRARALTPTDVVLVCSERGRVYNLERAHQDNLGYAAEDGAPEEQAHSANTVNTAVTQKKDKPGDKKELTREVTHTYR